MELELWQETLLQAIVLGTPLLFVASGELLGQKVGVFNIGIEGVMLMGAAAGFIGMHESSNIVIGILSAAVCGALFSSLFALATVIFRTNQVVSGFALWLLGLGLSSQIGRGYTAIRASSPIERWEVPVLRDIPIFGPILFEHLWAVYLAFLTPFILWFILQRTRHGLDIRAIGEDPVAADTTGVAVVTWRFLYVSLGGALVGLGGAFLSLGTSQTFTQFMTSGLGWIGLAIVMFAGWQPLRLILGAYLFGGLRALDFAAQSANWNIPSEFLAMLPFLGTLLVLLVGAWRFRNRPGASAAPAALGIAFFRGG